MRNRSSSLKSASRSRLFSTDTRGVSIAITHGLTIAITAVLLIGLLSAAGTLLDTQEERISYDQLSEINGDLTSQVNTVDRLAASGEDVSVSVTLTYPDRIMETHSYQIDLRKDSDGRAVIEVRANRLDQSVTRTIDTRADIVPAQTSGPDVTVTLCDGEVTLGGCP